MDRNLYDMIKYLQRGTNIHIGILFFGNYGNKMCELPRRHEIHSGKICEEFKTCNRIGYKRCFMCRNLALKKALVTKNAFGGYCINGVYEYTHPVIINNEVACVIFIGNILNDNENSTKIIETIGEKTFLIDTLEKNFNYDDCKAIGDILESYIRMLLEKHTYKKSNVNPLIENIKNYILSNLEFDINITHISKFFHYNKFYLGRLFKKETNININDYIKLKRIEKATKLLTNSNDSIINIANKVGFNNVTYFNRVFKSKYKITPTQYRHLNKKNISDDQESVR